MGLLMAARISKVKMIWLAPYCILFKNRPMVMPENIIDVMDILPRELIWKKDHARIGKKYLQCPMGN